MKCPPMLLVSLFAISLSTLAVADQGHHEALSAEQLGSVSFPTSCAANVQKLFERGVALLYTQVDRGRLPRPAAIAGSVLVAVVAAAAGIAVAGGNGISG